MNILNLKLTGNGKQTNNEIFFRINQFYQMNILMYMCGENSFLYAYPIKFLLVFIAQLRH